MIETTDPATWIAHYYATHDIRFVLCDNNGTEVCEVPRDWVPSIAHGCNRDQRGYVKQVATFKEVL